MHHFVFVKVCNDLDDEKRTGLEVITLEFILRLKIKCNAWLLVDTCPQTANHSVYFESETVLKFYNLEAWLLCFNCLPALL